MNDQNEDQNILEEIEFILAKSKENEVLLVYNGMTYNIELVERDFWMNPKDVSSFDGMIFMFSSISKESFDAMLYFYIRI